MGPDCSLSGLFLFDFLFKDWYSRGRCKELVFASQASRRSASVRNTVHRPAIPWVPRRRDAGYF